jgi:carboxylesterase type B
MKAEGTAFARTGNPTAAGGPVWPSFTSGDGSLMSLQPGGGSQVLTTSGDSTVHHCGF